VSTTSWTEILSGPSTCAEGGIKWRYGPGRNHASPVTHQKSMTSKTSFQVVPLSGVPADISCEEKARLVREYNEARAQSEQARLALEKHIAAHGC
jgi:hypothetical protein